MVPAMATNADTPPVTVLAPELTRYEYKMGYHSATVERLPDGKLWEVSLSSVLTGQLETLIYDDEELAKTGAQGYVKGLYGAEQSVRQAFYLAYLPAFGRGSAREAHGPNYTAPAAPPA